MGVGRGAKSPLLTVPFGPGRSAEPAYESPVFRFQRRRNLFCESAEVVTPWLNGHTREGFAVPGDHCCGRRIA